MKKYILLFTGIIFLFFATSAQALVILDQHHDPVGNFAALAVANDRSQIQTFTAGVTGFLSQVDVQVGRSNDTFEDLVLSIWSTDLSGLPLSQLSFASVPASASSVVYPLPFVSFNLSSGSLFVSESNLYALVLDSKASNNPPFEQRYLWSWGEEYGRGKAYTKISSSLSEQTGDLHF